MSAIDEARYSASIGEFLTLFNRRIGHTVRKGDRCVRVRPPDEDDFQMLKKDPRVLPFLREGSEGEILDARPPFLVRVGADSMMYDEEAFFSTFLRIVPGSEWEVQQKSAWEAQQNHE
jgi:hypothetical protein